MTPIPGRTYTVVLAIVGASALLLSPLLSLRENFTLQALLLLSLTAGAGWLRFELEPFGQVTLAPVVLLTAAVLVQPKTLLLIAAFSTFASSAIFARKPATVAARETGEQVISILVAILPTLQTPFPVGVPLGSAWQTFAAVSSLYIAARLVVSTVGARQTEGVSPLVFLSEAGRPLAGSLLFFALVAAGLAYLIQQYGNLGYFTLALATATLMDSYHPYKLLSEQRHALYASLAMISQAIDLKDVYTGKHARDVSRIAVRVARTIGLSESEIRRIRIAGLLHDIGKLGVSGQIIRKPSRLEPAEMAEMRQHPAIGAGIMQPIELLAEAAEIVRHHHEHYDGSGYPDGLRGDQIPVGSRVVLVADAFNAMTTDRPYRRGFRKEEALNILEKHAGTQFDPEVVKALTTIIGLI